MDEKLVGFLRELIDARNAQLERLVPDIFAAAHLCVGTLTNDSRILCWGNLDCYSIAMLMQRQLLNHYRIERPNLPCMLLDDSPDQAIKQIKALSRPGDLLVFFCCQEAGDSLQQMLETAGERNLKQLLIGDMQSRAELADPPTSSDDLAICLDVSHKAQVLDSQLAIALSLAGLIDHLLFGSEL